MAESVQVATESSAPRSDRDWKPVVARYQRAEPRRAVMQLATTLLPLALVFWAMYGLYTISFWWTLLLILPAAGLIVRTFILMHDCTHGSFFASRRANQIVGTITGVLTLTPFDQWRHEHALHHASAGDLDRRGHGDIGTLTIREYMALTPWARFKYRFVRHPVVYLGLGPILFFINQRIPPRGPAAGRKQIASVWLTNGLMLAVGAAFASVIGLRAVLLLYLPAYYVATLVGIGLFFVQHQFEDTYWADHEEWDYADAAIAGSSYFMLPAVLRWVTGNIGLHHVHHLSPRIPNYNLQRCHDENPLFHGVTVITLRKSLSTLRLALWDEEAGRLVRFREALKKAA